MGKRNSKHSYYVNGADTMVMSRVLAGLVVKESKKYICYVLFFLIIA